MLTHFAHDCPYLPRVVDHVDIIYCYQDLDMCLSVPQAKQVYTLDTSDCPLMLLPLWVAGGSLLPP